LGVVLLGNNLVNAAAAALVTLISFRLFGENELALTLGTVAVTFLILVFSEVTPKVLGAAYPDRIAPAASFVLAPMLKLFYPAVWFVNLFVQGLLLRLMRLQTRGCRRQQHGGGGVAHPAGRIRLLPARPASGILMNLFDLEHVTVDDAMRPRGQIEAIDLAPIPTISRVSSPPATMPGCRCTRATQQRAWAWCMCAAPWPGSRESEFDADEFRAWPAGALFHSFRNLALHPVGPVPGQPPVAGPGGGRIRRVAGPGDGGGHPGGDRRRIYRRTARRAQAGVRDRMAASWWKAPRPCAS
jgi:hypothetical protein